ncbi:MAG: capsid cement protein [Pseudomonadota bacterium]
MIPKLTRSFKAAEDITGHLIASFANAATDATVGHAGANTEPLLGVFDAMGAKTGKMVDVHLAGEIDVRAGGTFPAGAPLTADANGKAVLAAPAAGTTVRVIGFAMAPAVADDIVTVMLAPSILHTAA